METIKNKIKALNTLFISCSSIIIFFYLITYGFIFIYILTPSINNEIFSNILIIFLNFILQYIIMYISYKIFYNNYKLKKDISKFSIKSLIAIAFSMLINIYITNIITYIFTLFNIPLTQTIDLVDYPTYILFPISVIIAPIIEEIFFRGILFDNLKKYGTYFAIIFSSLAFGLFHGTLIQIPITFIIGIMLCLLKIKYKSIIPCFIFHILNNLMAMLEINMEINNIVVILGAIIVVILIIRYRKIIKNIVKTFKDNIINLLKSSWFYIFLIITIIQIVLSI